MSRESFFFQTKSMIFITLLRKSRNGFFLTLNQRILLMMKMMMMMMMMMMLIEISTSLCSPRRGCNPPRAYSEVVLTSTQDVPTLTNLYQSSNADTSLANKITQGVDLVRKFMGTASNTRIFYMHPNGVSADYEIIKENYCNWAGESSNPNCASQQISSAQNGGGDYYVSPSIECSDSCGNDYAAVGSSVWMNIHENDFNNNAKNVVERAVHEYTHAVQMSFGGPIPTWLMEGGAVFMECVMNPAMDPAQSFSDCFRYGGGRGGILQEVHALYSANPTTTYFTTYASDRPCGNDAIPPNGGPGDALEGAVYYDLGALAIAYAINQSSGKSFVDFWTSTDSNGFWHNIEPYAGLDYEDGWPSDVEEGVGWKKALCEFTGFETYEAFCVSFETWIGVGSTIKTIDEMATILESNAFVASNNQNQKAPYIHGPLCGSGNTTTGSSSNDSDSVMYIAIGIGAGCVVVLLVLMSYFFCSAQSAAEKPIVGVEMK